jgi:hypothetical protein
MRIDSLGVYLNDHLAGSVGALELLDHLISEGDRAPIGRVLATLKADIAEDQVALQTLLGRLGIEERRAGKALAWLGEKVARLKLRAAGASNDALQFLEGVEALALGIQGKAALWRSLVAVSAADDRLSEADLAALEGRALDQFARAEALRLAAAVAAFAAPEPEVD